MTQKERLQQLKELNNPALAVLRSVQMLKGDKGDKGDPGYTPIKGSDYFTDKEVKAIIGYVQSQVKPGEQGIAGKKGDSPVKGIDYWTTGDKSEMIADVLKQIKMPKDGISPKASDIAKLVIDEIAKKAPEEEFVTVKQLTEFLRRGGFRGGGSSSSSGTGTVTTVSVTPANGFAGTVANATTTPAITISTSVTGLLKGNGTAVSAAVSNTDYQAPIALTTTGTTGAATFNGTTLNIPNYSSGSGGITRSVSSVAVNTAIGATASTDYVYFVSGTTTMTLPTAVGNTNRYTLVHTDTSTMTIATTGGQTIAFYPPAPSTTATVTVQGTVVELYSDGANWWTI